MLEKIRPIYSELQGYLSQAPTFSESNGVTYDRSLWEQLNLIVDELSSITDVDYNRFKIVSIPSSHSGPGFIRTSEYRSKLNGLICKLHAEYFNSEPAPFSGSQNSLNITQNQQQSAHAQIVMLLEFQELINSKLTQATDDKEKSFLESMKSKLRDVKSLGELIQILVSTAKAFGLSIGDLVRLFS